MNRCVWNRALRFAPIYQPRVWGGRAFESLLGRPLDGDGPFGESWELVDRREAQSVVLEGDCAGMELHALWSQHRFSLFGTGCPGGDRFPLLLKLLDARENLSVQVHPSSAGGAPALGEPKTEWWYVLDAEPHAAVYAGFRPGADRMTLERAIKEGGCEPWLHRIPVRKGDSLFVPGGRIHAIGGGCLIAEVQQNSDTTFRVFDWNRKGPDGLPRALHREQSLRCIRFDDPAPALEPDLEQEGFFCEFFSVSALRLRESRPAGEQAGAIFLVAEGAVSVAGDFFQLGDWFLLPAEADGALLAPAGGSVLLVRVALPAVAGAPVY